MDTHFDLKHEMNKKIINLLSALIQKDFQALNGYEVSLKTGTARDCIATVSVRGSNIVIWLDKNDLKRINTIARMGAFANIITSFTSDKEKTRSF